MAPPQFHCHYVNDTNCIFLLFKKIYKSPNFRSFSILWLPYFDHDAFMHHAIHVLVRVPPSSSIPTTVSPTVSPAGTKERSFMPNQLSCITTIITTVTTPPAHALSPRSPQPPTPPLFAPASPSLQHRTTSNNNRPPRQPHNLQQHFQN